ncbi:hypothetical protein Hanom_Chr12g01160711 [Helianthus anomalus]
MAGSVSFSRRELLPFSFGLELTGISTGAAATETLAPAALAFAAFLRLLFDSLASIKLPSSVKSEVTELLSPYFTGTSLSK